ncbi:MAG: hypothetical protein ISR76_03530 [Planctomycetes bacterium]|nr:hypothetical protein [Planctomycetota bacterium]
MDPRLPRLVDELQDPWQLPFGLVDLSPELPQPSYAVVADDGTIYRPNGLPSAAEREAEAAGRVTGRRFGWAVAARVQGRDHLLATSAFAEQPAREWLAEQEGSRCCWLLRAEKLADGVELRPQRGPEPVVPRRPLAGPVDLLCDLGMVLCRFDRAAFGRNFRSVFGHELPEGADQQIAPLRLQFEAGELGEDDFAGALLPLLRLAKPDREALERVWGSIFEPKRSTLHRIRQLAARPEVELVVVSNTDPWALRACRERFGLEDLLYGAVASFQDGLRPKGEDASLWLRAREAATARRGAAAPTAIAVDDVRTYLHQALQSGAATAAVHYRSYPQMDFELRRLGL